MKHTQKVATEVEYIDHVSCDLCKRTIADAGCFAVDDIEVSRRVGDSFSDGGYGTKIDVDLCGECFAERLVPWLREQGADVREEEWEW